MEGNDRFSYILGFLSNSKERIVGIINELQLKTMNALIIFVFGGC